MFELLLQADKSMSDGLLDQAERTYWQLIELDPTNSIAVAGLARISLERGDERLARTFADRALGIDPDSIAARRIILALDAGASTSADPSPPDPQLRGAERLEALSRRRAASEEGEEGAGAIGGEKGSARPRTSARAEALPSEPLSERRRAGRLAAAAAAAAAAVRETGHPRHEPHRAMPSGRHLFQPGMLKAPAPDPFSEAEMAAAVAAVDSLDDAFEAPVSSMPAADVEPPAVAASDLEHVLEAVDATEAGDSVALRLAFLSTPADMPPETEVPAEQAVGPSVEAADAPTGADEPRADAEAAGATEPMTTAEPDRPAPAVSRDTHDEEPSEADAEMQALREAFAIVMAGPDHAVAVSGSASGGETEAGPSEAADGTPSEEPSAAAETPRKKGLFRRFRGS